MLAETVNYYLAIAVHNHMPAYMLHCPAFPVSSQNTFEPGKYALHIARRYRRVTKARQLGSIVVCLSTENFHRRSNVHLTIPFYRKKHSQASVFLDNAIKFAFHLCAKLTKNRETHQKTQKLTKKQENIAVYLKIVQEYVE